MTNQFIEWIRHILPNVILLRLITLLIISSLSIGCGVPLKEEDVIGTYVAQGYVNTIDSLRLRSGGIYERLVYTKDRQLALSVQNNWEFRKDGEIVLHAFFFNLDRDLSKFPELIEDLGYHMNVFIYNQSGSLEFCTGYYEGENCYRRISR